MEGWGWQAGARPACSFVWSFTNHPFITACQAPAGRVGARTAQRAGGPIIFPHPPTPLTNLSRSSSCDSTGPSPIALRARSFGVALHHPSRAHHPPVPILLLRQQGPCPAVLCAQGRLLSGRRRLRRVVGRCSQRRVGGGVGWGPWQSYKALWDRAGGDGSRPLGSRRGGSGSPRHQRAARCGLEGQQMFTRAGARTAPTPAVHPHW